MDLTDVVLSILNVKYADLAMFLSSWIDILSCYSVFNWLMLPMDSVKAPESMSNPWNLMMLYCELVNKLKT